MSLKDVPRYRINKSHPTVFDIGRGKWVVALDKVYLEERDVLAKIKEALVDACDSWVIQDNDRRHIHVQGEPLICIEHGSLMDMEGVNDKSCVNDECPIHRIVLRLLR